MKRLLMLAALLAAVLPAYAQQTGIAGVVTDAATGLPIEHALVQTMCAQAFTGPDGHYLLQLMRGGAYRVGAGAPGYDPEPYPDSVIVVDGQVTDHIDFALRAGGGGGGQFGGIVGQVIDPNTHELIRGATVTATGPNGERQVMQMCRGYFVDSLAPGAYWVTATADGYQPGNFPDSVMVQVGPPVPNIDIVLVPSGQPHPGGIAGVVTDANTHELIRGAMVVASNGGFHRQVVQMCNGYFIPDLPPGRYFVGAVAPDYDPGSYPESVDVAEGQTVESINVALTHGNGGHGGGIAGTVTNNVTGEPVFGAMVEVRGPGRGRANTGPDGRYHIDCLPPGTYEVFAGARGFERSAPDTAAVVEGQMTDSVDFALTPEGGRGSGAIAGTITDSTTGLGIAGARVFAWGREGQGFGMTDSSGNYLLRDLRPGSYIVRACQRGYFPGVYPDTVAVGDSQTVSGVNIALAPVPSYSAGMGGFVYDGSAQTDIVGATVTAVGPDGSYQTVTGAYGEYVFDNLGPGDYDITVTGTGYSGATYPDVIAVEQGQIEAFTSPAMYPLNGVEEARVTTPTAARLSVQPNPFSDYARLSWQVPVAGFVTVRVYDNTGRVVRTLEHGYQAAGTYSVTWDGTSDAGKRLANGVYFYRMDGSGLRGVQKVVLSAR